MRTIIEKAGFFRYYLTLETKNVMEFKRFFTLKKAIEYCNSKNAKITDIYL